MPFIVAPKIKTPLNDIRIKAGLIFHLDVDFIGEPVPEVIWNVGTRPLTADERTTVTSIGYHTIIHTVNVRRSDSGEYHLLLRNSSGIDEGSFQLIVLGMHTLKALLWVHLFPSRSSWSTRRTFGIRRSYSAERYLILETTQGQRWQ